MTATITPGPLAGMDSSGEPMPASRGALSGAGVGEDPVPGSPIAWCRHKQVTHTHGSRTGYVLDKCRCRHCRRAATDYANQLNRRKAYGRPNMVDAEPARTHVRNLMAQGMGWKRIARTAGVANGTMYAILYGKLLDQPDHPDHRPPRKQIRRDIAEKLLAVRLDLAGGVIVDGTGTRRRLQALVACGWSQSKLAARIGWTVANLNHLVLGRHEVIVATATLICGLYDDLWNQPPPEQSHRDKIAATRARRVAAAHGWVPPLAWDDDTIDDPAAQPDLGEPETRRGGVDLDEVRWLLATGVTPVPGRRRTDGATLAGIAQAAQRAGDRDLRRLFDAARARAERARGAA